MKKLIVCLSITLGACAPLPKEFKPYEAIPSWQGTKMVGGNYPLSSLSESGNPDRSSSSDSGAGNQGSR